MKSKTLNIMNSIINYTEVKNTKVNNLNESEEYKINSNDLTKEQLWKLRQEVMLGSIYIDDYKNSLGLNPESVMAFFDSFIEDAQMDDDGNPNGRDIAEFDNAEELYNYYMTCEYPFGEGMNESAEPLKEDSYDAFKSISDTISNSINNMNDEDITEFLQNIIGICRDIADDKGLLVEGAKIRKRRKINESYEINNEPVQLYMNTWGNYNENGADVEEIGGGWMSVADAREFCKAHAEEEPFINDTDNCPIEVDEYDNPLTIIEHLELYEGLTDTEKEALIAITDSTGYDFEENMGILQSGDYIFFPGVDNSFDLGKAYADMVGGIEGINNIENYINTNSVIEEIESYLTSEDDYSDEELNAMAEEEIRVAVLDNNTDFIKRHLDYAHLGNELLYDGYYLAKNGAIYTM